MDMIKKESNILCDAWVSDCGRYEVLQHGRGLDRFMVYEKDCIESLTNKVFQTLEEAVSWCEFHTKESK